MSDKNMMVYGRSPLLFFRAIFIAITFPLCGLIAFFTEKYHGYSPSLWGWMIIVVIVAFLFLVFVIDFFDERSIYSFSMLKSKSSHKIVYFLLHLFACVMASVEVFGLYLHLSLSDPSYRVAEAFLLGRNSKAYCDRLISFEVDGGVHEQYCVTSEYYNKLWGYGFKYRNQFPDARSKEELELREKNIRFIARDESKKDQDEDVVTYLYPPMMYMEKQVSVLGESFSGVDLGRMPDPKPQLKPVRIL